MRFVLLLAFFIANTELVLGLRSFYRGRSSGGGLGSPDLSRPNDPLPKDQWFAQFLDHFNPTDARTWKQVCKTAPRVSIRLYIPPSLLTSVNMSPAILRERRIPQKRRTSISDDRRRGRSQPKMDVGRTMDKLREAVRSVVLPIGASLLRQESSHCVSDRDDSEGVRVFDDIFIIACFRDLSVKNLVYLSSEQALADLAYFIEGMNLLYQIPAGTKWIAFGGSYPGSLAAWLRAKYPHLVHGAMSASGPLLAKIDFQRKR